jgi:hypothetical protein
MDWGPIMVTALICCTFYWHQLLKSWLQSLLATFLPLLVVIVTLKFFFCRFGLLMSLGYPILAILVLTPLFLCIRHKSFFRRALSGLCNDLRLCCHHSAFYG